MKFLSVLLFVFSFSFVASAAQPPIWEVQKAEWSKADEEKYSEFIERIYQAVKDKKCGQNLYGCLENPSINPYRNLDVAALQSIGTAAYGSWFDCGRCPIYLRTYFAYHNKLPFSHVSSMTMRGGKDPRYGLHGSIALRRAYYSHGQKKVVKVKNGQVVSIDNNFSPWKKSKKSNRYTFRADTLGDVNSGFYRFGYKNDYDANSDLYPIALSRATVVPGVTWYEPNGHVAQIGSVDEDTGKVYLFNCHVDGSLSAELLSEEDVIAVKQQRAWGLAPDEMGAFLKAWKPVRLENYTQQGDFLVGGDVVVASLDELKSAELHSTEQYQIPYLWNGTEVSNLQDYIRTKVSGDLPTYRPADEIISGVTETCTALQDRVKSVNNAIAKNIHKNTIEGSSTKGRLPENIYNTHHYEWELFSTPSRDVAIKTQFQNLFKVVQLMLELYDNDSPQLIFEGTRDDLIATMKGAYNEEANQCVITYTNSNNVDVDMGYFEFVNGERLFGMSFDPYHCPERRWAAQGDELASCKDSALKGRWYQAQQKLRNQVFRDGERQNMDMSLNDLETKGESEGNGWEQAPNVDVNALFDAINPIE